MDIVAALFIDDLEMRDAPGPSTRIDLTGVKFSMAAPAAFPVTIQPHLVVLIRCGPDESGSGALEVVFRRGDEQVARNVQPLAIDPGRFGYRLVRAELAFDEPSTIEAHCRVGGGPTTIVPLTMLPPVD